MTVTENVNIKNLYLDLGNFRTITQKNEVDAVSAMITIKPDWFWSLTESLLDDGYSPTENIIVLKKGTSGKEMIVKEGNRRIGAMKIIFGLIKKKDLEIPSHIQFKINNLSKEWKLANETVPCAIYEASESDVVDRIITRTHGKGSQTGRDMWNAVAKARHNRDINEGSEPSLDLLEKYLAKGKNITAKWRELWSGDYPLSVLDDAMKRIFNRFEYQSYRELVNKYPKVNYRASLEDILRDVGLKILNFKIIRDQNEDFAEAKYNIPVSARKADPPIPVKTYPSDDTPTNPSIGEPEHDIPEKKTKPSTTGKQKAVSLNDPKAVKQALKKFSPKGNNREKVVTLLEEARGLILKKNPLSFCFLLRSMFEISAKAYCSDYAQTNGPKATKANGDDRNLVDILRDIYEHLTNSKQDRVMVKLLHGAMAEIASPDSFLSVTSLNQLIHNPRFSVNENHISTLFSNIFPFLEAMNK